MRIGYADDARALDAGKRWRVDVKMDGQNWLPISSAYYRWRWLAVRRARIVWLVVPPQVDVRVAHLMRVWRGEDATVWFNGIEWSDDK